jgi:hypothetical protein
MSYSNADLYGYEFAIAFPNPYKDSDSRAAVRRWNRAAKHGRTVRRWQSC